MKFWDINISFYRHFPVNSYHVFMRYVLLSCVNILLAITGFSQQEAPEEIFDRVEKFREQADHVKSAAEGAMAYIEGNNRSLALTVVEKLKPDEIYIDDLFGKLNNYLNTIKIPAINAVIDLPPQTNNLLKLREVNAGFIDHFYDLQERYYSFEEIRNNLKLVQNQIGLLHDLMMGLSDCFLELSTKFVYSPASAILLDKSDKCRSYAKKCNDTKETYTRKSGLLEQEKTKFNEWAKNRITSYEILLSAEMKLQNNQLAAFDEFNKKIKTAEDQIAAENKNFYSLNNQWQQAGNSIQAQQNRINTSQNNINNYNGQIAARNGEIAELEKNKKYIENMTCPEGRTYTNCVAHPDFVKRIRDMLAYKDQQIGEKRSQINGLNNAIGTENQNISKARQEIQRLNNEIEIIKQSRSKSEQKLQLLRNDLNILQQQKSAHPEWEYLQSLREEATRDMKTLQSRKIFL